MLGVEFISVQNKKSIRTSIRTPKKSPEAGFLWNIALLKLSPYKSSCRGGSLPFLERSIIGALHFSFYAVFRGANRMYQEIGLF